MEDHDLQKRASYHIYKTGKVAKKKSSSLHRASHLAFDLFEKWYSAVEEGDNDEYFWSPTPQHGLYNFSY